MTFNFAGEKRVHLLFDHVVPKELNLELIVFGEFLKTFKLTHEGKIVRSHTAE